jgi:hypothetical protein
LKLKQTKKFIYGAIREKREEIERTDREKRQREQIEIREERHAVKILLALQHFLFLNFW